MTPSTSSGDEAHGALPWIAAAMLSALAHALLGALILHSTPARTVTAAPAAATDVQLTDWLPGPAATAASVSAAAARFPAPFLSHLAAHPLRAFRATRPIPTPTPVPPATPQPPQVPSSAPLANASHRAPAAQLEPVPLPGRPVMVDTTAARNALAIWEAAMSEKLERFKRYPEDSRQRHEEDVVSLRITVSRSGQVLRVTVVHSRGFMLLDQEALQMVQQAAPLPPLPDALSGDRLNVVVPVEFFLVQGIPLSGDSRH
jgi:periplasmic protein TonB